MTTRMAQQTSISVNGEAAQTTAATLADLIDELGFAEGAVATALNGDFVPKAARSQTRLASDDRVEIVTPRQGG
jgi:sulfur carrier protein